MRVVEDGDPGPTEEYEPALEGQSNGKTPRVQAQSYAEFKQAAEADAATEWVLKPFLPPTGIVVVAGEQKSGKTLWASWLVAQVLHRGMRVLFVELEGSRGNLLERLDLFCSNSVDRLGLFIRWRCGDKLDASGLVQLLALVDSHQPNLIVIDPLFRAMQGDENESKTWRPIVENLEALSTLAQCPVAILHHVRKAPSEGRDAITSSDVRGSSALLGAASVVAIVHKKERTEDGTARFDVICADSWYAPFPTQRCLVTFGAEEGQEAMSFVSEDEATAKQVERSVALRRAILKELDKAEPRQLSGRDLRGLVGGRADAVGLELAELAAEGQVIRTPGPKRAFLYRLAHLDSGTQAAIANALVSKYEAPTFSGSDDSGSTASGSHSEPREPVLPTEAVGVSGSVVPTHPFRGGTRESLKPSSTPVAVPVPILKEEVEEEVEEVVEAVPVLSTLGCLTYSNGRPCGKPVVGVGVWCEVHKAAVMKGET